MPSLAPRAMDPYLDLSFVRYAKVARNSQLLPDVAHTALNSFIRVQVKCSTLYVVETDNLLTVTYTHIVMSSL